MEHLISPQELEKLDSSIPRIPWLEFNHDRTQEYPVSAFEQYPVVRGWPATAISLLRLGSLGEFTPESILSMLQSWLFFGVLEAAFQDRFPSSLFIRVTPRGSNLNTSYLRSYCRDWNCQFDDFADEPKSDLSSSFNETLAKACDWVLFLHVKLGPQTSSFQSPRNSSLLNAIIRSTLLLIDLLGKAVPRGLSRESSIHTQIDLDPGSELFESTQKRGWCPSAYTLFMNKYGPSVAAYASLLEPNDWPISMHERCSSAECVAYNVDVTTYKAKHLTPSCQCNRTGPSAQQIKDVLESRSFPVLNGELLLDLTAKGAGVVTPYEPGLNYVAFSHVWSDGLGSVTEEGLPICQVQYLTKVAKEAGGTSFFWIDGLCVPKEPAARRSAIHKMSATCRHAPATIVLDAGLKKCSTSRPLEEITIRILSSVWMRRLWTLQEASFAENLIFVFQDQYVDLANLLSFMFTDFIGPILAAGLGEFAAFNRKHYDRPVPINFLRRQMAYRTSSRLDDETLALAPMLNIDVSALTGFTGEKGKTEFWRLLERVQTGIVFSHPPRLREPGFRWAPSTLMYGEAGDYLGPFGHITSHGLKGEYSILVCNNRWRLEPNTGYYLYNQDEKQSYRVWGDDESAGYLCDAVVIPQQSSSAFRSGPGVALIASTAVEATEVLDCELFVFSSRLLIQPYDFNEYADWTNLPEDAVVVRSQVKEICIA